jgi:hypothetical protein
VPVRREGPSDPLAAGQPKFIAIDRDCAGFESLGHCRKPGGQACFEALQIFLWASR